MHAFQPLNPLATTEAACFGGARRHAVHTAQHSHTAHEHVARAAMLTSVLPVRCMELLFIAMALIFSHVPYDCIAPPCSQARSMQPYGTRSKCGHCSHSAHAWQASVSSSPIVLHADPMLHADQEAGLVSWSSAVHVLCCSWQRLCTAACCAATSIHDLSMLCRLSTPCPAAAAGCCYCCSWPCKPTVVTCTGSATLYVI